MNALSPRVEIADLHAVYETKLAAAQAHLQQLLDLQSTLAQMITASQHEVHLCQQCVDACQGRLRPEDYIV